MANDDVDQEDVNTTSNQIVIMRNIPRGFRFRPSKEELVRYYLLPRLLGRPPVPNAAVIEANVYLRHPAHLIAEYRERGDESWHFLTPRARKYTKGERPSRHTEDGLGRWKASTGMEMAVGYGVIDGGIRFCHRVLRYHNGTPKKEIKTKWLMLELTIPEFGKKVGETCSNPHSSLDEYVMCEIYVTPRFKNGMDDDEPGPSGVGEESLCSLEAESVQAGRKSSALELWEEQADKKVPRGAPSTTKRARQRNKAPSGTPAPDGAQSAKRSCHHAPPSGTAAPPVCYIRPTSACDVGAVAMQRPLAYQLPGAPPVHYRPPMACNNNNGMRMPVPPTAYNNNDMRMPVPPTAYNNNGMRMPMQQQPVPPTAYSNNGMRMPVLQQRMAYNNGQSQPPVQCPQTVANNNNNNGMQVPKHHQMITYNGHARPPVQHPQTVAHNNTGIQRPPASTAVPSAPYQATTSPMPRGHGMPTMLRPSPALTSRQQPESTDELRKEPVYRQDVQEWQKLLIENGMEAQAVGQHAHDIVANYNHQALAAMAPPVDVDDRLPPPTTITCSGGEAASTVLSVAASTSGSGGEVAASTSGSGREVAPASTSGSGGEAARALTSGSGGEAAASTSGSGGEAAASTSGFDGEAEAFPEWLPRLSISDEEKFLNSVLEDNAPDWLDDEGPNH